MSSEFWPDINFPPINLYSLPKGNIMNDQQEKLSEMFAVQDALNQMLHKNWKQQPWSMAEAIIVECGELFDELGYKWWKFHVSNYDNVRLELVDLWHFIMNTYLIDGTESDAILDLQDSIEHSYTYEEMTDDQVRTRFRDWLSIGLKENTWRIDLFLGLCLNYGLNFDELYWLYMFKNTLNIFRWNNGYSEGTYIKDWNGKEDNEVLMEIYNNNKEATFKELYKKLERYYFNKVAKRIQTVN